MYFFYKNIEPVKQSIISIHKKFILLLIVIVTSINTYAQDPQLFENDWYLQKVVIDGEDFYPPYPIDEIERGRIYFEETTNELITYFCDGLTFQIINYEVNNVFNLQDYPMILVGFCILIENTSYSSLYGSVFYNQPTDSAKNPFNYTLSIVDDVTTLIITNGDGDIAIYGNEFLSNQDFVKVSINIYPNPVKNTLQISTENSIAINNIAIFDILGKKVLATQNTTQIDVSALVSGLLFVKITTDKGVVVKKVMKQ